MIHVHTFKPTVWLGFDFDVKLLYIGLYPAYNILRTEEAYNFTRLSLKEYYNIYNVITSVDI